MPKIKLNFNRELDFVEEDEGSEGGFFKNQLVAVLRQGSSTKNIMEAAALNGLISDIARSDDRVMVSGKDLEVLEDNINRILEDEDAKMPNFLACEVGELIQEGKEKLEDVDAEGD